MRLFLLPISTRRTLIYCERIQETTAKGGKEPLSERILNRASTTWATWEKAEKGWQKKITVYGNQLFKRIPYEEWGLKSIPPATKARLEKSDKEQTKFECLYPGRYLNPSKVASVLQTLATERQALHKRKLWSSILWMPITIPFTVVPVIPNLPFFYLCFRAYSHYRALYGGRFLEHILQKDLVKTTDSRIMDEMYTAGLLHPTQEKVRSADTPSEAQVQQMSEQLGNKDTEKETMLLRTWNGKIIAEAFKLPEMEIEIERAVEQVEKSISEAEGKAKEQSTTAAQGKDEKQS